MNFFAPSCAFGSAAVWAVASVWYSRLSKDHSVFAVNFARASVAFPLFILAVFIAEGGILKGLVSYQGVQTSHLGWLSLSVLTSFGFGDAAFFWSTRFIGVPTAMAIAFSYPVLTMILSSLLLAEAISRLQMLGVVLTAVGVAIVILECPALEETSQSDPLNKRQNKYQNKYNDKKVTLSKYSRAMGLMGAFVTSLLWSLNSFATSKGGVGITTAVGGSIRMMMALLLLLLIGGIGKVFTPGKSLVLPVVQIRRFFWVFVLEAFCGTYLYVYGLSHSSLVLGVTLSSLSPVISVPVAVLMRTEKFSFFRTLGVCLAVFGPLMVLFGV